MIAQLPQLRIAQPHRRSSLRCRPNDSAIGALPLIRPDGSDGKLGSRLACARGSRTPYLRSDLPVGIVMNQIRFDVARPPHRMQSALRKRKRLGRILSGASASKRRQTDRRETK
jgi:hypothetical protein